MFQIILNFWYERVEELLSSAWFWCLFSLLPPCLFWQEVSLGIENMSRNWKEGIKANNMWTRQDCLAKTDLVTNSQLVKILDLLPQLMHNWLKSDEISVEKVQPKVTQSLIEYKLINVRIVFQEGCISSLYLSWVASHYCQPCAQTAWHLLGKKNVAGKTQRFPEAALSCSSSSPSF